MIGARRRKYAFPVAGSQNSRKGHVNHWFIFLRLWCSPLLHFGETGRKAVKIFFKAIGFIFLIWLAMHIWNIFSPMFLPGTPPPPRTSASLQQQLIDRSAAEREGPEALEAYLEQLDRSRPFDNSLVIYYVLPLFLVWLICAMGQARQLSPLAFTTAILALWLCLMGLVQVIMLIAPYAGSIGAFGLDILTYLSDAHLWRVIGLLIGIVVVVAWRTPRFVSSWVFALPRLVDDFMREVLNDEDGWVAQEHGEEVARWAHLGFIVLTGGLAAWVLWQACDSVDGPGIPDTFGFVARLAAVGLGATLMIRTHFRA